MAISKRPIWPAQERVNRQQEGRKRKGEKKEKLEI
jgi:hypothetical protein